MFISYTFILLYVKNKYYQEHIKSCICVIITCKITICMPRSWGGDSIESKRVFDNLSPCYSDAKLPVL